MELERSFINLNRQKGTALSQITLEEDLNVPDQKAQAILPSFLWQMKKTP